MSECLEKETTFTPGPWSVGEPHPQNACAYVFAKDGYEIATLYGGDEASENAAGIWGAQPTRDATAALVAAAPELYWAAFEAQATMMRTADILQQLGRPDDAAHLRRAGDVCLSAMLKARGEDRSHEGK